MGSFSIGGTLSAKFSLRSLNPLVIDLMIVWAFISPVGGQASLFLWDAQLKPVSTNLTITYLSTDRDWVSDQSSDDLYSAALLTPGTISESHNDIWGNVKIPDLLRNIDMTENTGRNSLVNENAISYSSLIGIPIRNRLGPGSTTFTMETSYLSVTCLNTTLGPLINFTRDLDTEDHPTSGTLHSTSYDDGTFFIALDGFNDDDHYAPEVDDDDWGLGYPIPQDQRTLLVQSIVPAEGEEGEGGFIRAYCPSSTTYLSASVFCVSSNCTVTAILPSKLPHPPCNLTIIAFTTIFSDFVDNLIQTSNHSEEIYGPYTLTQFYIVDPTFNASADMRNVSASDFALRFEQVLNTYWQTIFGKRYTTGAMNDRDWSRADFK